MSPGWFALAAAGALVLGLSVAGALGPFIAPAEQRAFHAVNGLPEWVYFVLWLPMQLGNLVVGTVVGLLVALAYGNVVMAVGVVAAMALKLVAERVVRRRMAEHLAVRQRPGTSEPGAVLRGDVPASGPSFPSGHVILVAAVASVVAPALAVVWWWVPGLLMLLVMVGRVYVAAHNPLDVTAGLGAGLLVGGVIAAFVR
jgi:membrane-associated phospholipid phosphatase